jgi:hypothetical protein
MKKIFSVLLLLVIISSCTKRLPSAYTSTGKDNKKKFYVKTELNDCKMHKHPEKRFKADWK